VGEGHEIPPFLIPVTEKPVGERPEFSQAGENLVPQDAEGTPFQLEIDVGKQADDKGGMRIGQMAGEGQALAEVDLIVPSAVDDEQGSGDIGGVVAEREGIDPGVKFAGDGGEEGVELGGIFVVHEGKSAALSGIEIEKDGANIESGIFSFGLHQLEELFPRRGEW